MAKYGLEHFVIADAVDNGTTITYSNGMVLDKARNVKVDITTSDAVMRGDNGDVDSDDGFSSGKISAEITDMNDAERVATFGYVESGDADTSIGTKVLTTEGAAAPIKGFGFCGRSKRSGAKRWRSVLLVKTQFKDAGEEYKTRDGKTEFMSTTLDGTVLAASWDDTYYKRCAEFATRDAAIAWLDAAVGISTGTSNNLSALSFSAGTLTPTFAATTKNYYCTFSAASSTLTATFAAGTAKLYIDGVYAQTLATTVASSAITLVDEIPKSLKIVIKEAGKTEVVYNILAYYNAA